MDYKQLLEQSYTMTAETVECGPETRLEYLGDYIFDFTTYDGAMSSQFASKAVEVCSAINDGTTFDYIENDDNYRWFLLMCNTPFFADKLKWGASIRGAWWGALPGEQIEFQSSGLWIGDKQLYEPMKFSDDEWKEFIAAVVDFAAVERRCSAGAVGDPTQQPVLPKQTKGEMKC